MIDQQIASLENLPRWKAVLLYWCKRSWIVDTDEYVPSDQRRYLYESAHKFNRLAKFAKRLIIVFLTGQYFLERRQISAQDTRILWINFTAPSLGDSLMDLSSRVLLAGRELHLFSNTNLDLYRGDTYFSRVSSSIEETKSEAGQRPFDLVIMDSFSPRSILMKLRVAPHTPFVVMYGYLNGFEVHRTFFSFSRMKKLLGLPAGSNKMAIRPYLTVGTGVGRGLDFPSGPEHLLVVAICVGAEWDFRRYKSWDKVIADIHEKFTIVLVGSSNGAEEAESLVNTFPRCKSYVGTHSLLETISILKQCDFVLCADGGLWHIACGLERPSVVLFADCQLFDSSGQRVLRDTADCKSYHLYHLSRVSEIKPESIVQGLLVLQKTHRSRETPPAPAVKR